MHQIALQSHDVAVSLLVTLADVTDIRTGRLAPQFIRYTVNCISRDSASHLLTYLVVYIIARCSSLNTTAFFLPSALSLTSNTYITEKETNVWWEGFDELIFLYPEYYR
jgi:hypothetical protein